MSETLDETLKRKAEEWSPDDINAIIEGLRNQRERWNLEQQRGSRKRITAKSIDGASSPAKKGKFAGFAAGLKGVKL